MPPVPTRRRPPPARGKPESRRNRPAACKRTGLWPVQAVRPAAKREKQSRTALGFSNRFPPLACGYGNAVGAKRRPLFAQQTPKAPASWRFFPVERFFFPKFGRPQPLKQNKNPAAQTYFATGRFSGKRKAPASRRFFFSKIACGVLQDSTPRQSNKKSG